MSPSNKHLFAVVCLGHSLTPLCWLDQEGDAEEEGPSMGQVQRLLLATLCKPAGKVWAGDMGTPGQGTVLLPLREVTREARNPGAAAGLWGDGVCSRGGWAAAGGHSHGASFTSPLTGSGSTGTSSLLALALALALAAGSTGILAPAEHHKPQLLPRPVLFTPFPGAESQVGEMLGMPSWVISISPAGSQSMFLGCPSSLPPLSHGAGVPQEPDRDRDRSLQGGVQLCVQWGARHGVPEQRNFPGSRDCLCPGCFQETSAWGRACPSATNNCSFTPVWQLWLKVRFPADKGLSHPAGAG